MMWSWLPPLSIESCSRVLVSLILSKGFGGTGGASPLSLCDLGPDPDLAVPLTEPISYPLAVRPSRPDPYACVSEGSSWMPKPLLKLLTNDFIFGMVAEMSDQQ